MAPFVMLGEVFCDLQQPTLMSQIIDNGLSGLKSIFETDFKRHSEPRLPSTAQINPQIARTN